MGQVRRHTAEMLDRHYPAAKNGFLAIHSGGKRGQRTYVKKDGKWHLKPKEPKPVLPEKRLFCVYGGGLAEALIVCRCPTKINWHRKLIPALVRMARKLGIPPAKKLGSDWWYDGLEDIWDTTKHRRFDFVDGEFVELFRTEKPVKPSKRK